MNALADLQAAFKFIEQHGSAIEKCRLSVLLGNRLPESDVAIHELVRLQREDGGCAPFWAADTSSVDATCYWLAQCEQLGVAGNEACIQRALEFLSANQRSSGLIEEDDTLVNVAPPWARPGDLEAQLYLTANAGFWLCHFDHDSDRAALACHFLRTKVNGSGFLPTFLHANWLAAGLFFRVGELTAADGLFVYLQRQLATLEPSQLAWLLTTLCVAGVSSQHVLVLDGLRKLSGMQLADGRWASEDGEWQDVHTTLEVIRATLWVTSPSEQSSEQDFVQRRSLGR
ncbi:prenyltransferase/squalene oxidase repeat-containing protein [Alicyclobacillus dauci]|uniref:Uncharacterized protein n=1 Tax=Alicyclobacillus dauci TaxID=1475485 RepID=A0ABY6Z729_9BACL|nr:hypothetical protein [Alicyclobacillus dauci]WAH38685.1 hypothetical protein NZD86_09475 [Alicyclobacillus dauci]